MTSSGPARQTPTPALLGIVPLLMILLYGVDVYLARLERTEVRQEAERHFARGSEALRNGEALEAIEPLRQAYSLERRNRAYALALASAQMSAGQTDSARFILDDLLRQDPNNGRANLLMARLTAAHGNLTLADSFYHRAIYGAWDSEALEQRLDARLELAWLLAEHGAEQQLLAEILTLQVSAPASRQLNAKIAALYLRARSATHAVAAYRALVHADPEDAESYAGLAESELLVGNYRLAQSAFANALRRRPGEAAWENRARLAAQLLDLDPTIRRLGVSERFRRSAEVLARVESRLLACLAPSDISQGVQTELDHAVRLRAEPLRTQTANEQSEALLDAASALWAARVTQCAAPPAQDDPLAILMSKLAAGG